MLMSNGFSGSDERLNCHYKERYANIPNTTVQKRGLDGARDDRDFGHIFGIHNDKCMLRFE